MPLFKKPQIEVRTSPHVTHRQDVVDIMQNVVLALLPVMVPIVLVLVLVGRRHPLGM